MGGGLLAKSCLRDSMDYSPPGSSVHEISQARILEWVAIFFSSRPLLRENLTEYKREREEIQVQSMGQEDPLEKEMATHSSILA